MLNVNVNVNVNVKCSVYMSDLKTEPYNIYGNWLSVTLPGIPCGQNVSTNSGHRRAVQPTQLRSPSNTDHTTIARQRYLEKNYILGTCDPFTAPADICISITSKSLPELQFGDIYIYLIENPSPYTPQKMKAYKSTDSYLIFRSGWVHNAVVWKVKTKNIFIIRVKMSAI